MDDNGLIADPRLHHRRAPGNTCLSALGAAQQFGDLAQNDSKGCGTIMRVAPVAFSGAHDVAGLAMKPRR
jgi:ADP-ribosylglycohydrolase